MPILYLGILDAISIYVDITIAYTFEIGIIKDDVAHTHRLPRNRQVMTQTMPILWCCGSDYANTLQMITILIRKR